MYYLTIGDEILIGQIVDTNSAWLASKLNELGIDVVEMRSVGDELQDMIAAIEMCQQKIGACYYNRGLGPTKDDITKTALCRYYGVGNDLFWNYQRTHQNDIRKIWKNLYQGARRPVLSGMPRMQGCCTTAWALHRACGWKMTKALWFLYPEYPTKWKPSLSRRCCLSCWKGRKFSHPPQHHYDRWWGWNLHSRSNWTAFGWHARFH